MVHDHLLFSLNKIYATATLIDLMNPVAEANIKLLRLFLGKDE